MLKITNDRDYRIGYEILNYHKERGAETGNAWDITNRFTELKRNLRQYGNRPSTVDVGCGFKVERRIVQDRGMDGYTELVSIPEVFTTLADDGDDPDAESFFKSFIYIEPRPSAFDCTGRPFTSYYKLFRRRGQFWAYHQVCYDV